MIIKRDNTCTPVGKNRTLHIYLPDNYYDSDERYPVMYFFDGHNLFLDEDATYGKCWGLKSFLDGWWKDMIIVGIECGHEGRERLNEYSPYYWNSNYIGKVEGIGETILDWMAHELKPMIDSEYRTWPHREATGIGGSSMGGLMSLYGVTRFNDTFSKAACLSSTVIPCYRKLTSDIRAARLNEDTRIWLSYGEDEAFGRSSDVKDIFDTKTSKYTGKIMDILADKHVIAKHYMQPGGRHCEADWEKQVPAFMEFLWM
ncbi:MAG: alpha/beta hydrolase-fold protein [Eubacteriales bacterium]|nr:alpha/beta hydrolase-fold protein [Eubacteriales bacterium]